MDEDEINIQDVIDVSLLSGDAALESVNHGIVECTCDRFHTCQHCDYVWDELKKSKKTKE